MKKVALLTTASLSLGQTLSSDPFPEADALEIQLSSKYLEARSTTHKQLQSEFLKTELAQNLYQKHVTSLKGFTKAIDQSVGDLENLNKIT